MHIGDHGSGFAVKEHLGAWFSVIAQFTKSSGTEPN
jgi:hypothetical protein